MFTLKVVCAETEYVQAEDANQFCVTIEILKLKGDKAVVLETRKLGFPITATEEEIGQELQKFITTYESDYKQGIVNKEAEEVEAQAQETIDNISDKEFKPKEND